MTGSVVFDAGSTYPSSRAARDRFVLSRRGTRPALDALAPQGVLVEPERTADGDVASTATVFLTGRECPWRCVMCDLWRHTTETDTPAGAIARQVALAVAQLPRGAAMPSVVKLYNAGSFFDPRAVPPGDDDAIVEAVQPFVRVVVESHPALVGDRTWRLREALARTRTGARLEVAMGLETAHPGALERLNKRITIESFAAAARALASHDVDLRVFLLIHPPFVPPAEHAAWLARSVDVAFDCGATAISLIPTRTGNGALEALEAEGVFAPPGLSAIEHAAALALARARGRVFVDVWDLARFASCAHCAAARGARLSRLNLEQRLPPPLSCDACREVTPS